MKFKTILLSFLILTNLSACSMKKTINDAHKVVESEQLQNDKHEDQETLDEENLLNASTFNINITTYIKEHENKKEDITYSKKEEGEFTEHILQYPKGNVIETMVSVKSEQPISYNVEVANQSEKSNGKISNGDLGINLMSNFLLDAQIIEKPLNLLIDLDVTKRNEYQLTENISLTLSPQRDTDGFILQLAKKK